MKIRLVHPITHDGTHYDRGVYDLEDGLAKLLLGIHSPACTSFEPADVKKNVPEKPKGECRNHSAIPFVEQDPVMGKARPAADAKPDPTQPPPNAGVAAPPEPPDSSGPDKTSPAPDAPKNGKK